MTPSFKLKITKKYFQTQQVIKQTYTRKINIQKLYIINIKSKKMIKKFLLLSVVISQLTISCSKEDTHTDPSEQNLNNQIAEIVKLHYYSLKQKKKKVKIEVQANNRLI